MDIPPNLSLDQRQIWCSVYRQGFGDPFFSLNPYDRSSPLYHAWRSGFIDGHCNDLGPYASPADVNCDYFQLAWSTGRFTDVGVESILRSYSPHDYAYLQTIVGFLSGRSERDHLSLNDKPEISLSSREE